MRTDARVRTTLAASIEPGGYRDETAVVEHLDRPLAIVRGAHERIVDRRYFDDLRSRRSGAAPSRKFRTRGTRRTGRIRPRSTRCSTRSSTTSAEVAVDVSAAGDLMNHPSLGRSKGALYAQVDDLPCDLGDAPTSTGVRGKTRPRSARIARAGPPRSSDVAAFIRRAEGRDREPSSRSRLATTRVPAPWARREVIAAMTPRHSSSSLPPRHSEVVACLHAISDAPRVSTRMPARNVSPRRPEGSPRSARRRSP